MNDGVFPMFSEGTEDGGATRGSTDTPARSTESKTAFSSGRRRRRSSAKAKTKRKYEEDSEWDGEDL